MSSIGRASIIVSLFLLGKQSLELNGATVCEDTT